MSAQRRRAKAIARRENVHRLGICRGCRFCMPIAVQALLAPSGLEVQDWQRRMLNDAFDGPVDYRGRGA